MYLELGLSIGRVGSLDWSDGGVDWRDSSKDEAMAADWLRNERLWQHFDRSAGGLPPGYDLGLDDRVRELVLTDLDPERGWRLALHLMRLVQSDADLTMVAASPLDTFIRNHGDMFFEEIDEQARSSDKFRRALKKTLHGWPRHHRKGADC